MRSNLSLDAKVNILSMSEKLNHLIKLMDASFYSMPGEVEIFRNTAARTLELI